ncbi:MAG: methyl-accepting chemotaxis protein, partial [Spirochaetes bacterium]|nr:methyl-accepting chemotaxis protein [Spirochaetota bacterium]
MKELKGSLSVKILGLCISLVLFAVLAITLIYMFNMNTVQRNDLESRARVTMQFVDADLRSILLGYTGVVDTAAAAMNHFVLSTEPAQIRDALIDMVAANENVAALYFASLVPLWEPGGFVLFSGAWVPPSDWDMLSRPWHIAAMARPYETVMTDAYIDATNGEVVVSIARIARNADGVATGIMGGDVFLTYITEIVHNTRITADGSTFLIDGNGRFLVHPNPDYILSDRNIFAEIPGIDRSVVTNRQINIAFDGNGYIASTPLTGTEWTIVSTGSLDELRGTFFQVLRFIILSGIFIIVLGSIAAIIFSRILSGSIKGLFGVLRAFSAGDFTQKIEVKGNDEISQMTQLLVSTQESIKNLICNIKKEAESLSGIGGELTSDMNKTSSSIGEINSNTQQIKERILNQSSSVTQTHATMEQVVASIGRLNRYVEQQGENILKASQTIDEMVGNINSASETLIKNTTNVEGLQEAAEAGRTGLSAVMVDIQEIARES